MRKQSPISIELYITIAIVKNLEGTPKCLPTKDPIRLMVTYQRHLLIRSCLSQLITRGIYLQEVV